MAIISLSKAALLAYVLGACWWLFRSRERLVPLKNQATPAAIALALLVLAISTAWSEVPPQQAWGAWVKHAKLLLIPLMLLLIRSENEARIALVAFIVAQAAVLLASWMLWLGITVPWATSNRALADYAVFSSRLDQPIMSSVTAAVCWHLRDLAPGRRGRAIALGVMMLAIINVLLVMNGRTGHVVLVALISFVLMWQIPRRYRLLAGLAPFFVLLAVVLGSTTVRGRMLSAVQEVVSYAKTGETNSSSGERLNYWRRSIESIVQHPVAGSGAGSWNTEYQRLDQGRGPATSLQVRNPHQEFLLWGVEAGLIGAALLCNLLLAIWRDTRPMSVAVRRATQSVLAALIISCMFNSSLFDATIGDFFCVALALLMALGWHARHRPPQKPPEFAA